MKKSTEIEKVRIDLGERSYDIRIATDSLPELGENLEKFGFSKSAVLVTNPTVGPLYEETVRKSLEGSGFEVYTLEMPDGEEHKHLGTVKDLYDQITQTPADRKSPVIALGGGVVGDTTGFVASTYKRGLPFIQVPTTLLAQVDASVGGKTGVDHPKGKNLIGAFYQPKLVLIDPTVLKTLPLREYKAGLAEVVKHAIIRDQEYFEYLESNRDSILALEPGAVGKIIARSCHIKGEVVIADEREAGLRAILNCGHTVAHGLEAATGYKAFLHGEAVAVGLIVETRIAVQKGWAKESTLEKVRALLELYGLPTKFPSQYVEESLSAMHQDKKVYAGKIAIVFPEEIGKAKIVSDVDPESIRQGILAELSE